MSGLRITLIGGRGRVGGLVAPILRARGHQVLVADLGVEKETPEQTRADAMSHADVARVVRDADLVVHMAVVVNRTAEEDQRPDRLRDCYAVNVGSVAVAVEQCRLAGVPLVQISSMSVFSQYGQVRVDPAAEPDSTQTYGFTKRLAEQVCSLHARAFPEIRVTSLRLAFPTPDDVAPLWKVPFSDELRQVRLLDGTPVDALPASQLAMAIEQCADMPAGHRVQTVTAGPEALLNDPSR